MATIMLSDHLKLIRYSRSLRLVSNLEGKEESQMEAQRTFEYAPPEVIELGAADQLVRFVKVDLSCCDDACYWCTNECGPPC